MPVIVLTADVQMAQRQTYLSYGFDECLLKPVSLGHFKRLLIRWGLLEMEQDSGATDEQGQSCSTAKAEETQQAGDDSPVDFACVEDQMGAMDANAADMLGMFVEMSEGLITRIRTAYENADAAELAEAAHSLKGSARSACCTRLGDIATELQTRGENGELPGDVVDSIEQEFKHASEAIAELQQNYG
jgi:HPt (histidine-containing phosphotransfer) domain-containing protein